MNNLNQSERRLLDAMQKDTNLSQIDLAELSGKSRTSVWRLIREFEDAGLIEGKVALLNPKELGLQIHVMLSVSMVKHSDRTRKEFESHVQSIPEVMECYLMTGEADFLLRVVASDAADFERIHSNQLTRLPGVTRVHSSFSLRTIVKKTEVPIR